MDTEARASHGETFRMINSFHKACPEREVGVPQIQQRATIFPKSWLLFIWLQGVLAEAQGLSGCGAGSAVCVWA